MHRSLGAWFSLNGKRFGFHFARSESESDLWLGGSPQNTIYRGAQLNPLTFSADSSSYGFLCARRDSNGDLFGFLVIDGAETLLPGDHVYGVLRLGWTSAQQVAGVGTYELIQLHLHVGERTLDGRTGPQ